MTNTPSYVQENAIEREHLKASVSKLSDEELSRPLEAGWTVSAVLAHLAFWDQRALVLLGKWEKEGIGPSPIDVDIVNEATRIHCLAIPPQTAVEMAINSASAIDAEIEHLSPDMAAAIEATGKTVRLNRAQHRREHLSQIEKALGVQR
jgi:hypothetical protein